MRAARVRDREELANPHFVSRFRTSSRRCFPSPTAKKVSKRSTLVGGRNSAVSKLYHQLCSSARGRRPASMLAGPGTSSARACDWRRGGGCEPRLNRQEVGLAIYAKLEDILFGISPQANARMPRNPHHSAPLREMILVRLRQRQFPKFCSSYPGACGCGILVWAPTRCSRDSPCNT